MVEACLTEIAENPSRATGDSLRYSTDFHRSCLCKRDNLDVETERWDSTQQWGSTFFYPLLYYGHTEFGW